MKVYALVYTNRSYDTVTLGAYSSFERAWAALHKCNDDVRFNSEIVTFELDRPAPDVYLAKPNVAAVVADVAATVADVAEQGLAA